MPEPPLPGQQLDFEFLHSQTMMVMQEFALAEKYLSPDKDTPVALAHRIRMLRAIEAGDSETLGGEQVLQFCREQNLARDMEEEIIRDVRTALRNTKDTVLADRLLSALQMANAGKVSCDLSGNATGAALLAIMEFRQEHGRRPPWEKVKEVVESWRKDGLRHKDGTPPRKLDPRTWRRAFARLRALFPPRVA